jgi:hypothetical protein
VTAVELFFRRLGRLPWCEGRVEDLLRPRFELLAGEVGRAGGVEGWARTLGRPIVPGRRQEAEALDLLVARWADAPRSREAADPIRYPSSWSLLVRDGRRRTAPARRLDALARLLDGTRAYTRRQRVAAASEVFASRPATIVAQARYEDGWPLVVEVGLLMRSTPDRNRFLRAVRRAWLNVGDRTPVDEADLVDVRGDVGDEPYLAALVDMGLLKLDPDHPLLSRRVDAVLDEVALRDAVQRLPEDARRAIAEAGEMSIEAFASLVRAAPRRRTALPAGQAVERLQRMRWRYIPIDRRSPRLVDVVPSAEDMSQTLERAFSHPWYGFLYASRTALASRGRAGTDAARAHADHPGRALAHARPPRDRLGYLWSSVQLEANPERQAHDAASNLDIVKAWLRVVQMPSEAELTALASVARAYPGAKGATLSAWVGFADELLELGAENVVTADSWHAAWDERALDQALSGLPERRRERLLVALGRLAAPVRLLSLVEPRRTSDPERFEATLEVEPGLVARRLVGDRALRTLVRERIAAGDRSLRDRLVAALPESFAEELNVRTAVELALRSDLGLLPLLGALLRYVSFGSRDDAAFGAQLRSLYVPFSLPKRRGGVRTVHAPVPWLKVAQRGLLEHLFSRGPWPEAAHGFVAGRGVVSNAAPHARQELVVNVDIAKFFDSTSYERIKAACREALGPDASSHAVVTLAEICSYDGALPTGAPTSPAIGNLVLRRVDQAIMKAAAKRGVAYTRYADDLTFSGGAEALQLLPFARRLLGELGYQLDARKTNIFRRGRRQVVTGLVVNERPTASRTYRRRLRAAIHTYASTGSATWHGRPVTRHQLMGHIGFLAETRPEEARRLRLSLPPAPSAES